MTLQTGACLVSLSPKKPVRFISAFGKLCNVYDSIKAALGFVFATSQFAQ